MAKRGTQEAADDAAPVKARVLVRSNIEGEWYETNAIVTAPLSIIKALEAQGSVDSDEGAVAYVESLAAG
jgi:hypothetical protein